MRSTSTEYTASIWYESPAPGRWSEQARCRSFTAVSDVFTECTTSAQAAVGISICRGCGVRQQCLEYGRQIGASGIWGGELLTNGQSRALSRAV